jgi:nucleoside-diphosphate-sugar epimerase
MASAPTPLRVLVTGATGLAGSHTARALLEAGHEVRAFVRSPDKAKRVFAGWEGSRLETAQGDIGDVASVEAALRGCDGVVHCAAAIAVDAAHDPQALIETNVRGVRNVIGTAVNRGLRRIIHVSSVVLLFRSDGAPITESSEPQPSKHAYGQSKALADQYVRELQAQGHPVKMIYPGAIIGPDDPGLTESMKSIPIFMRTFMPITTSGIQYVDARDVAIAHIRLLEDEPGAGRYLAPGTFISWPDLARLLEKLTGERPRAFRVPGSVLRTAGRITDLLRVLFPIELPLSLESATYITKWSPIESSKDFERLGVRFRNLEETIGDTVRWLRAAGQL